MRSKNDFRKHVIIPSITVCNVTWNANYATHLQNPNQHSSKHNHILLQFPRTIVCHRNSRQLSHATTPLLSSAVLGLHITADMVVMTTPNTYSLYYKYHWNSMWSFGTRNSNTPLLLLFLNSCNPDFSCHADTPLEPIKMEERRVSLQNCLPLYINSLYTGIKFYPSSPFT